MKNKQYLEELSREDFERIDRYVQGLMQDDERQEFEESLVINPTLKNEVELHKKLIASLEVNTFFRENDPVTSTAPAPVRSIRPVFRRSWLVAASIVFLMATAAIWWMLSPTQHERLYTQHFSVDPGLPTNMGTEEEYEFYRGMVDYKSGQYELAITRWEKLYAVDSLNSELAYFLGVAWLNTGNAIKPQPFLQQVIQDNRSPFRQSAIWYLSLAHLKEGNPSTAIELLEDIPDYPGATELRQQLLKKSK